MTVQIKSAILLRGVGTLVIACCWGDLLCAQDIRVNAYSNDEQGGHAVRVGADGAWFLWDTPFEFCQSYSVVMRHADLGARFLGPDLLAQQVCDLTHSYQESSVAALPTGEFLVAREQGGIPWQIYGCIFDSLGTRLTADFPITPIVSGAQNLNPIVIGHPSGRFIVLWDLEHTAIDPYARVVLPDGSMPSPVL